MTNIAPSDWTLGYCTNVHAGTDIRSIRSNLERFGVPARIESGLDSLGVGLWLPASAAAELVGRTDDFANFLTSRNLFAYTINGFPYDNFHQDVVKHDVYRPTWADPSRLQYTRQLAEILAGLLPDERPLGSISTLPIGWGGKSMTKDQVDAAGEQLRELADFLKQLERQTGRRIIVAIEPEPGCVLDATDDVIDFFDNQLTAVEHRRYLGVCHDVCHAAVMMENQADVITRLAAGEITIGKVQVSSAVVADWQSMAIGRRREAIEQLKQFAEDRYLHQTGRMTATGQTMLAEDLPALIGQMDQDGDPVWGDQRWVVHFHVPVFLERFGHLTTTHAEVLDCLQALSTTPGIDFTGHLEIETYAWSVLPEAMRKRGLSEDIASELMWLQRSIIERL